MGDGYSPLSQRHGQQTGAVLRLAESYSRAGWVSTASGTCTTRLCCNGGGGGSQTSLFTALHEGTCHLINPFTSLVCLHWQTSLFTVLHEGTCLINPFTSLVCLHWQIPLFTARHEGTCLINPFTSLVCLHWQDSEMMSLGSSYVQSQENQQTRHFDSLVLCVWFGMNLPLGSKWKLSLQAWESVLEKGSLKRGVGWLVGWLVG